MPALLVPILAQAVALQLGDRTELRVVRDEIRRDLEAETRPRINLELTWPRASLGVGYAPSLRVAPIDSPSTRERSNGLVPQERFSVLHAANGAGAVSFGSGRTTLSLSQSVSWALRNFSQEVFSGGAPSTTAPLAPGQTPPPTQGVPSSTTSSTQVGRTVSRDLHWGGAHSGVAFSRLLSRNHSFGVGLGYDVAGGLGTTARNFYPLIHGPNGSMSVHSTLSRRTQLSSNLSSNYNVSEVSQPTALLQPKPFLVTKSFMIVLRETLAHQISRSFSADVSAGAGYSRNYQPNQPVYGEILPTGTVALKHQTTVGRGTLSTHLSSEISPQVNSFSGTIDWWYSSALNVGWQRGRWATSLGAEGDVSLGSAAGVQYRGLRGWATVAYDLRHGFSAEAGTRAIWEQVNGRYTILPSLVGFVALNWAFAQPL